MKKMTLKASVLIVGLIGIQLLSGCANTSIKQLSGEEFVKQAKQIEQINSFHWTTYIGKTNQRIYLEYGQPAYIGKGARTTVYWTPISELPNDVAKKIKVGQIPWKSPYKKKK